MAIVFDCPHCKTNYRLKDEFGGKTATCKNPNCRKVIPIPKAPARPVAASPADLDALAAAAFGDEPAKAETGPAEMIQVTCSGCDHVWFVEASREGKNVLCPECRRPNRVPPRKKEEKADWRTGQGPSGARRETGLDREGAFGTADTRGITDNTAREIVRGRADEEEPEERRKRWVKRLVWGTLFVAVVGAGGYFLLKTKREIASEANMADAVKEQTEKGTKDPRFESVIHRASFEHRIRTAGSAAEASEAAKELTLARTKAGSANGSDKAGLLVEIGNTLPYLTGSTEQIDKGERFKKDKIVPELRHVLNDLPDDSELKLDVIRAVTRGFAARGQATLAEDVAHQVQKANPSEVLAQIALELLRVNREMYKGDAEALLKKATANATATEPPGVQALRAALDKPPPPKKEGEPPPTPPLAATAEAEAIKGNAAAAAKAARGVPKKEDKAKALAIVGQTLLDAQSPEAGPVLTEASKTLREVEKAVSPWVSICVCRLLARAGQFDEAEALAASLPDDQLKAWGRLAALRGRLDTVKDKADDAWMDAVGDPAKLAAAAQAREEMARYNARAGHAGDYEKVVKKWPTGTVRPFGTAGIVLGGLDRAGK
jgi:hypothetical protein